MHANSTLRRQPTPPVTRRASESANPLWLIAIGMAVFFGFTAALMLAG